MDISHRCNLILARHIMRVWSLQLRWQNGKVHLILACVNYLTLIKINYKITFIIG
jgi:hypothetical protein